MVKTIAIIGGGASGTLVAVNLMLKAKKPLKIILIEKSPAPGKGVAYNTNNDLHLVNVPAANMSALAEQTDHFLNWLRSDPESTARFPGLDGSFFAPRRIYGRYIQDLLKSTEENLKKVTELEKRFDEAVDIVVTETGAEITLKSGKKTKADKVVLALGNFPPANPNTANQDFYKNPMYFQDPWAAGIFDPLKKAEEILIIGSGLTMVDTVLNLKASNYKGIIRVISPHGYLPLPHKKSLPYPAFISAENLPETVLEIFRLVRQHVKLAEQQGIDWRAVIDSIRPFSQKIWYSFTLRERKRFMSFMRHRWGVLRHRLPEMINMLFTEMLESGQIKVYAGRIQSFEAGEKIKSFYKERKTGLLKSLEIDAVINCTGPESNYNTITTPLVLSLRKQKLIKADPLSLGLEATVDGQIIEYSGKKSEILFTLGPPLKSIFWESVAMPELRVQSAQLALFLFNN